MTRMDTYNGCGITPFCTGPNDIFYDACEWHDNQYSLQHQGQCEFSRNFVDKHFLIMMLEIAGLSKTLQTRAYAYYSIARCLGWIWWYDSSWMRD